jgi:hypothetical protein
LSTYRRLDNLPLACCILVGKRKIIIFPLTCVGGWQGRFIHFFTDAERVGGGIGSGGRPSWVRFVPYRFIQIGPDCFDTLLNHIAVDLIPEMGLYRHTHVRARARSILSRKYDTNVGDSNIFRFVCLARTGAECR